MSQSETTAEQQRVVVLAATPQEAETLRAAFMGTHIEIVVCTDPTEYRRRSQSNGNFLLLTPSPTDISRAPAGETEARCLLAARTQELAHLRTEFEQFATIVSHDLRSPLLSMTGCIELLSEQVSGKLDDDGQELMKFVNIGANRLNEMIKGLLEFSRTGTRSINKVECSLDDIVETVIASFAPSLRQTGGRITHEVLPIVLADHNQMNELFRHLIDNALKFRGSNPPMIHIGCQAGPEFWTIEVKDNGIGIPPEQTERIFRIFQRLHGESSPYKGVGAGLAICSKIVERHGGRIWAQPASPEGSSFQFTLLNSPPA